MLNDFLITRDATSHLIRFLDQRGLDLVSYRERLNRITTFGQVSYSQWWALLDDLEDQLNEPALGIAIGQSILVEHCGVIGYLFRTSKNVLEALACYQRFERLLYSGGQVQASIQDKSAFCLDWDPERGLSTLLSDSLLLAALVQIMREVLADENMAPLEVRFPHVVSEQEREAFEAFFACPVIGRAEGLHIRFAVADLSRPIPFHDQILHELLDQQAKTLVAQMPAEDSFLARLRETIVQCINDGQADVKAIARQLGLSTRSLHRKLQSRGLVYRDVLRDVRKSLAKRYLLDYSLSLTEAALLLGYSEQSAFNRAFKEWFGMTPKRFQNQLTSTTSLADK